MRRCRKGHLLTPENTYQRPDGRRDVGRARTRVRRVGEPRALTMTRRRRAIRDGSERDDG